MINLVMVTREKNMKTENNERTQSLIKAEGCVKHPDSDLAEVDKLSAKKALGRREGSIDEFRMLWLPWATHRKVWHKMEVWTATRAGWPSKRPFCAILFYASPRATKACETRLF